MALKRYFHSKKGWQQAATIPDVATLEETTETETEVFVLEKGVELGKINEDGTLTCSAGMVSDGNGGCEPEGGVEKAELISDIENGMFDKLTLEGEFEGTYQMQNGLGKKISQARRFMLLVLFP